MEGYYGHHAYFKRSPDDHDASTSLRVQKCCPGGYKEGPQTPPIILQHIFLMLSIFMDYKQSMAYSSQLLHRCNL